jgi:vitamin K-dependent gamma-carboxylase
MSLFGLLLVFIPAHGRLSLDAVLRPGVRSDTLPAWGLWILRAQMAIVYFYAGIAKLNGDWFRGQPMEMMLQRTTLAARFSAHAAALGLSWGGVVFDLTIVPLLLWRRTRLAAFAAAVAFHLMNALLWPIDVFPWFAIAATTLFLEPDWPRRLVPGLWKSRARRRRAKRRVA